MKKPALIRMMIFATVFVIMFLFRIYYGYVTVPVAAGIYNLSSDESSFVVSKRNYASAKHDMQSAAVVDQKYEKIATAVSRSNEFEKDDEKIKAVTAENSAVIQFESKTGLAGKRSVVYMIGVPPEFFDNMVNVLKKVGRLSSLSINKSDKTNEYRELNARLKTLAKTRDSLSELKKRNASVDELITLENRILEIENEIQGLGVSLGDFDDENEFCTVNFTLIESGIAKGISFAHRVKVALEWTIKYYLLFTFLYFIFLVSFNISLRIIERLKLADKIKNILR
jgi:hypothetical protein